LCAFFFQSLDAKFSERISRTLDIGLLFAEQVYQKDLEKLSLSTTEASNIYVRKDYQEFSRTGTMNALENTLNKYFEIRNLDVLNLYDASGKMVAHATPFRPLSGRSFQSLIRQAYRGATISSIERFAFPGNSGQPETIKLEYVAVSPIFSQGQPKRVTGVLLTGQSLGEHSSVHEFVRTLPEMDLRIYTQGAKPGNDYQLLFSSIGGQRPGLPQKLPILNQLELKHGILSSSTDPSASFAETIGVDQFRSKALILKNHLKEPVGILVVSTPEKDLMELKRRNIWLIGICLLFVLGVVGISGLWFKQTFIDPVEALAQAAEHVAAGHLSVVIHEPFSQREIRNTIASFNRMTRQLQEDQRLRSTFISTLTHDLRTPLIAQKRVLELYEEFIDELPKEMGHLNTDLLRSNNHLLDMVNKLLETYQYEAGKIILHPECMSLYTLVEECVTDVQAWAAQKRITVVNDIDPALPEGAWDRDQLRRVFQNLIGNALENIQEGRRIVIRAQDVKPIAAKPLLRIEVTDNGPGIHPEILPLLFSRYFTGDRRRQKIGSGLGLYICRMIIELHGGTIKADSEPGQGTTFIIELPWHTTASATFHV
jgi:two-component system sensor histidine kinase/response regulator